MRTQIARLRAALAAFPLAATLAATAVTTGACGDAETDDDRDRGADVDGGDSYDPDDLDEREENE